jgi:cytochrome c6
VLARLILFTTLLCAPPAIAAAAPDPAAAQGGAQLYADNCVACHRPTGLGVNGAFPPLAGSPLATGDPTAAALRVLNGRGGMPAFKAALTDAQIADVLTYVRSTWGNKARKVLPATVTAARGAGHGTAITGGQQAH